jgi:serine/threonine-protein kinase
MARVFLAEELHPRRKVALKVLDPALTASLGPARFLREVELAAALTHPHILPIFSAGEAAGLLYYTMPYVEGQSLRDRLDRELQLPVDEAIQIARELGQALDYAHGAGRCPPGREARERHARRRPRDGDRFRDRAGHLGGG